MTFKTHLACLALLILSACGTERTFFVDQLSQLGGLLTSRGEAGPDLRTRLTPEALASLDQPILIINLPQTDSEAGAQLVRANGRFEIWSTVNGVQFTFEDGVLFSTRGIPGDLMTSDLREVRATMAARRGEAVRVNRYLDGEDQEFARAQVCDMRNAGRERLTVLTGVFETTKLVETCVSSTETVENQYWIDQRGVVRQSVQWIGPDAGYVLTERVND